MYINDGFKLTREYLFNMVADRFELVEKHLLKPGYKGVIITVFRDSSRIAHFLEGTIGSREKYSTDVIFSLFDEVLSVIEDENFRQSLSNNVHEEIEDKTKKKGNMNIRAFIVIVFKKMAEYHNTLIENDFSHPWFDENNGTVFGPLPQTFLSYSYDDKGLALGLFLFFLTRGGFLYVNWMWSGVNPNSKITKAQLEKELAHSGQLLFLRTLNSELEYYGGSQIRQWCSWEIGNYYTKRNDEKFIIDFYGNKEKNDLLQSFKPLSYVIDGKIYDL